MPRSEGEKTQYPGVYRLAPNQYRVRAQVTDPRTGKRREKDRLFTGTAKGADAFRAELEKKLLESRESAPTTTGDLPTRPTVGEFSRSWLETKQLKLDPYTFKGYATALAKHALRHRFNDGTVLGEIYFDTLRAADVQAWVNAELEVRHPDGHPKAGKKMYAPQTVHSWFRAFRTMARKAVVHLRLGHDPSMLIEFPELDAKHEGDNRLEVPELQPFLDELRIKAPQHHALTCTLAWTGLRFCHASALMWDDISEVNKTIKVERKNVHGRIGKVSKKKRAPEVLPLEKELADVLRWHRERLMNIATGEKRVGDWVRQGLAEGWVFPARGRRRKGVEGVGPIHSSTSLRKSWEKTLKALQDKGLLDDERFTIHGLRRTFNDMLRHTDTAEMTADKMTAQTPEVRRLYQTVDVEEMRAAMQKVRKLMKEAPELRGPVRGRGTSEGTGEA